jgi:hypothetical protein
MSSLLAAATTTSAVGTTSTTAPVTTTSTTTATTTTTTTAANATTHLTGASGATVLWIVVAIIAISGVLVILSRVLIHEPSKGPSDISVIRSWLAIALVAGLLVLAAASFLIDDTSLRSAAIGGVVANAGAAVAFYFASKASDRARQDILGAAFSTVPVPDLVGMILSAAQAEIAKTSLILKAPTDADANGNVTSQDPPAATLVRPGTAVTVTVAAAAAGG